MNSSGPERNPWQLLRQVLEEERRAIISGKIETLLACLERKERLLADPALREAPVSPTLREEITWLLKHNQDLLRAGLSFIEEAYRFLSGQMSPNVGYQPTGKAKACQVARLIDGVA